MPYIIDGHNLIGAMPGIELSEPEDERRLAEELQAFAQRTRRSITVYFDRGTPGFQDIRSGLVSLKFVSGRSADLAIAEHVRRLGGAARNWTVISSDREVQAEARAVGARVLTSQVFAAMLRGHEDRAEDDTVEPHLSDEEIAEWEALFKQRTKGGGRSSKT